MIRYTLFCLITACVALTAGCTTRLNFPVGAPYQSPYRIDDSVIVVFPDALQERTYRIRVGGFLDRTVFIVPVKELYRAETVARMNGMFLQGVSLTDRASLAALFEQPDTSSTVAKPPEEKDETRRELDLILADLEASESGDKTIEKSAAELTREATDEAQREAILQKDSSYILVFRDAQFDVIEGRPFVTFQAAFMDARTNNVFFDKRYQGRAPVFRPKQNNKTNEGELVRLTRIALGGAMMQMSEDIAKATGSWTSRR